MCLKYKVNPNIVYERIDDEIFLLSLANGDYYQLSFTASKIWDEVISGLSFDEILKNIDEFDEDDIANDIKEIIDSFIKNRFIKIE